MRLAQIKIYRDILFALRFLVLLCLGLRSLHTKKVCSSCLPCARLAEISDYFEYIVFVILLMFFLPLVVWAQTPKPSDNLAQYSSDIAECQQTEKSENICLYSGNASFIRGDEKLRAQKIAVYKNAQNQIYKIIAFGDQSKDRAYYDTSYAPESSVNEKQEPHEKKPVNAVANVIKLFPSKNTALFIGDAKITRDKDSMTGSYIEYDIKKQTMFSRPDIGKQTTIVLYPKQK